MPSEFNEERVVSSTDDTRATGNSHAKVSNLTLDLTPHQKLTQCLNNLNIKAKTIKFLGQNICVIFMTLDLAMDL